MKSTNEKIESVTKKILDKIDIAYKEQERLKESQYPGNKHGEQIARLHKHRSDLIEIYEELKEINEEEFDMAKKTEKITVEIYPPGTGVWFVDVYEDTVITRYSKVEDVQIYKNGIFYDLGDATDCASQHVIFPELGHALAHAKEWWDSKFGKESKP